MAKKHAIIVMRLSAPTADEAAWNEWYNTRHLADRLKIPGWLSARRFKAVDGKSGYMTLYELADATAINHPDYAKLREWEKKQAPDSFWAITRNLSNFTRGIYEQVFPETGDYKDPNSNFLFVVGHDVPRNHEKEFNAWYNTEHIPAMFRVPGFLTARRFVTAKAKLSPTGGSFNPECKYLSIYDIASEKVFDSPEFNKEKDSPWASWVRSWYTKKVRCLYRKVYPKT